MPLRSAAAGSGPLARRQHHLQQLRLHHLQKQQPYVCPSCRQARASSSFVSSSAINARRDVPSQFRRLHNALIALGKHAANYVNLSGLQLAIQSVESNRPTIRIALLGLGGTQAARRIARLLLADPLEEQAAWEHALVENEKDDAGSTLLRYGQEGDRDPHHPLLNVVFLPSPQLKRHNLEILIASLPLASRKKGILRENNESPLVPLISTPKSASGSPSMVRHPVHRALVIGEGLDGCMALGGTISNPTNRAQIGFLLDMRLHANENTADAPRGVTRLDSRRAEEGLDLFRRAPNNNGEELGRRWGDSGMAQLGTWLSYDQRPGTMSPPVFDLVQQVIKGALSITSREKGYSRTQVGPTTERMRRLGEAVSTWSAGAHAELQQKLDEAFASDSWAEMRWWKLFWGVDDVEMVSSRLLEKSWLLDAEKGFVWLCGRACEAGLLEEGSYAPRLPRPDDASASVEQSSSDVQSSAVLKSESTGLGFTGVARHSGIEEERRWLSQTTIPELQRRAQGLVMQTLSLTGVSTGFSALMFVAWPETGLYGAGAFALLGLAVSLRRMQTKWETARAQWESQLREQGRRALRASEEGLRAVVAHGPRGREAEDSAQLATAEAAERAIAEAQAALDEAMKPSEWQKN